MIDAFGQPQTAVVLGGTSDIAQCLLRRLVAERCRTVVLAGRDRTGLEERAKELEAAGATSVRVVEFEATDVEGAPSLVGRCFEEAGGPVDLVVMAVGLLGQQERDETDPARVAEVLTVNFTWPAAALAEVGNRLRTQGAGRLVVLSSVAGVRTRRANYVYGSAKAGLDGYATGMAEALRGTGAAVQVVRPGFVHTKMTAGRPAAPFSTSPEVVAEAIVKGLARGTPVIWVPPTLRLVFTIMANLPQAVWRRLPG